MSYDADGVVERRRLRRRAGLWRLVALALVAGLVFTWGWRASGLSGGKSSAHVARVSLEGVILGNSDRRKMFRELGESNAQAVILEIDSPGGGVTASEELYIQIRELAEKKPVVAVLGSVAASGGYIAAIASDRIFARETSITGSIGVLVQYPNFTDLLGDLGVDVEEVKSSPLKASPNMVTPTSPEARRALEAIVMDSYDWFKTLVSTRRGLQSAALDSVSDGRIFTGRQAIDLRLVDEIGGEREARAWLARERGVSADLSMVDWKPSSEGLFGVGVLSHAAAGVAEGFGLSVLAHQIRRGGSAMDLGALDGLVAIWHPSLNR